METWQAILDLGRFQMSIKENESVEVVPFIEDTMGHGQASPPDAGLESELFFVQRTHVYDGEKIAIVQCVDPGSFEQNLNCIEGERGLFLYSENEINDVDPPHDEEIQILSVSVSDRTDSILIQKVHDIDVINETQKQNFYRCCEKNLKFSLTT